MPTQSASTGQAQVKTYTRNYTSRKDASQMTDYISAMDIDEIVDYILYFDVDTEKED